MANDTRSSRNSKSDETKSSKGTISNGKGSTQDSGMVNSTILRRSSREAPSKDKIIPCPSSIRRSERLEKQLPTTSPVKKKSEKVEKQTAPSSLRRSLRGKNQSDESPVSDRTTKKKSRTVEDGESSKIEKQDSKPVRKKKKEMIARTYLQMFIQQSKRVDAAENMQDSVSKERTADNSDLLGGGNDKQLKRKRNPANIDVGTLEIAANKENCTSTAESSQQLCESDHFVEKCVTCSKKQRLDIDLPDHKRCCSCEKSLDQEICHTSVLKGRSEVDVAATTSADCCNTNLQQMEPPQDIQSNIDQKSCVVCKLGGKLLCCDGKGCNRSYHASCLNPPLECDRPGFWLCLLCIKKKIESCAQSVSEGIESIWDSREVVVSDLAESLKQKQYFVKYKGLAHVHNQWIAESQLLLEAPSLVTEFTGKKQVTKWKLEWTMPQCLLKKRLVDSHCEWLVKWRGLEYEHATWELANSSIFNSPEAASLIKKYENRHEKANKASLLSIVDKMLEMKKGPLTKLLKLPVGGYSGIDNNYLVSVNKLREYWHKGWNGVVFDDLDRVVKVISFILSLQSGSCHPFLIVTNPSDLLLWETEFRRLAPSIDLVVYSGNRENRKSILRLELYVEDRVMFEVLLSPPEAIVEDLELFKCLTWEAIILDGWQNSNATYFERIKKLVTGFRLVYVFDQLKDSATEYIHILSLLQTSGDNSSAESRMGDTNNISALKDSLSLHITYHCKSDCTRFSEYWVPVQISNVQLEKYCETLLSNYALLRSCTKNDHMGAIREILNSVRKCCNHPFLIDSSLQALLVEDLPAVEYLDVGIKASGKLQLLEKMLSEMKKRGLRVLILLHAIDGYGKDSTMGYLDDFLRQIFGPQSYERIDGGGVPSKNKAALKRFKEESERFVFLLDSRACLPSIKLSSVDCIIIFDSDWNPMNDLRALQKITIESKSEPIKVFRLYSSFTVEEKVLIYAKQGLTLLDSSLSNISCSNSHILLMWGALHLFNKCDKFHELNNNTNFSRANISSDQSLLKDVIQELKMILSQDTKIKNGSSSSTILKVQQNGGVYGGNVLLLGELEVQSMGEEVPHSFWFKLLEGRHPRWKYLSDASQRNRKRVKYNDNLSKNTEIGSIEVVKKRKKVINSNATFTSTKPGPEEGKVLVRDKKGNPANASQTSPRSFAGAKDSFHATQSTYPLGRNGITPEAEAHLGETGEIMKKRDAQKNLHLLLKPKIYKLCEILKFKEDVKDMVGRLLEYVMENHQVQTGSTTILQAFQLSLCWIATSLLKHDIDWKDSLAVAQQHLEFGCKPEDVHCVYSMLLKKLKSIESPFQDLMGDPECSRISHFNVNLEGEGSPLSQECPMGLPSETRMTEKAKLKAIKHTEKIYRKHMLCFDKKQNEEVEELERMYDEEKVQLEKENQVELAIMRSIHSHHPSIIDKMKKLKESFEVKLKEHSLEMDLRRQNLKKRQVAEKNVEEGVKARLLEALGNGPKNVVSTYSHPSEDQSIEGDVPNLPDTASLHCGKRIAVLAFNKSESKKIDETNTLALEKVAYTQPDGMESPGSLEKEAPDRDVVLEDGKISPDMPETAQDEVVEDSQFNRAQDGPSLVNSPSLSPAEGLREALQLQDECFQLPTTPAKEVDVVSSDDHEVNEVDVVASDDHEANEVYVVSSDNPIGSPLLLETLTCSNSTPADQSVHTQVEIPFSCHATTSVPSNQEVPPEDAVHNQPNPPSECASTLGHTAIEGNDLVPLIHSQLSPSIELASYSHNQLDLPPSTSGMEYLRSTEDHVNAQTTNAMVDNITGSLNRTSMEPAGTPLLHARTVVSDFSNCSIQTTSTVMASRMTRHTYFDPLQNESERIRRETEQTIKIHEEAKLRFQSDREKEIEEAISQIRRKYDTLAQDTEQQFQIKKQVLDSYFKKVYMNKMLAEAFRSKCMDLRVPGKQGLTQNQSQVSLPRPPIVSNTSTVGPPVARPRIATSPSPIHPLSSPSSVGLPARHSYVSLPPSIGPLASPIPPTPARPSYVSVPPSVGTLAPPTAPAPAPPPAPAPHVQIVHNSASLFSNSPNRPPLHINTINPPLRNFQVGSGIRAPAPHLQPFRTSLPSNSPLLSISPLAPNSSSPSSQHPARPNLHSPSSAYGPHQKPPVPESGPSLPDHHNTNLGDNNENRSSGPIIPNFPSLPKLSLNFDPLDFIEFGTLAGTQVDSSTVDLSNNVVCLSDDE